MAVSKEEILNTISSMSVLELSELIKEMETKFGVSAARSEERRVGKECRSRWSPRCPGS